jgi:hypothetical protein
MPPARSLSCKSREMLRARLRADLKVYAEAVDALEQAAGKSFERAVKAAEHARLAFNEARSRLNAHTSSHGCW